MGKRERGNHIGGGIRLDHHAHRMRLCRLLAGELFRLDQAAAGGEGRGPAGCGAQTQGCLLSRL
ncbi:MAG TPA: hypothetical protein VKR06_17760 [Ktedonosporobacter sp.]|nr:hypothetical protein [Ktedonosporobacter sp.]